MAGAPDGYIVGAGGGMRPIRIKGSSNLFNDFYGISREKNQPLDATPEDLAKGFALAVWAYRCIKLRMDALAAVQIGLEDGNEEEIPDHPVLDLLTNVNSTLNYGDLMRFTEAAYCIWGRSYWLFVEQAPMLGIGNTLLPSMGVTEINWLNPITMKYIAGNRGIAGFEQRIGAQSQFYPSSSVAYFRNFNPLDDLGGLSPLSVALQEINAELNAVQYVESFFGNDARPAGLLTTDQPMMDAEIERTRTWWEKLFKGVENKWKTGIVGGGLKWQQISFPPDQLAMPELREEDRRAICAAFGVPPALAGAWEASNFATAKEAKASLYQDTIIPQLEYYGEVLNFSLLSKYPDLVERKARIKWKLNKVAALQESTDTKATRIATLFEKNVMKRNEARAELGLDPVPDEEDGFSNEIGAAMIADMGVGQPSDDEENGKDKTNKNKTNPVTKTSKPEDKDKAKALRDELDDWQKFQLKRLKPQDLKRAFRPEYLSAGLATDLQNAITQIVARSGGAALKAPAIKALFETAKLRVASELKALPTKLDLLPIYSNPLDEGNAVLPELTEEEIEQILAEFRKDYKTDLLDTEAI